MPGQPIAMAWNGRQVTAWLPDLLHAPTCELTERTRRVIGDATTALIKVDASLPTEWESFARILLRAEGIASSSVEGITAPAAAVFAAIETADDATSDVGWVADNLAVVAKSLEDQTTVFSHQQLFEWHRDLMRHSRLPSEMIGSYRAAPGWIGGTTPATAAYVAPPPDQVEALMDNLITYLNTTYDDPVTQAAIAHGQFETIHPFGDGNGRLGRVLIARILARRCGLVHLPPPTSVLIARDTGGYIAGLWQFREGSRDLWVRWFADIVRRASMATAETLIAIDQIRARWSAATSDIRADSGARALLDVLIESPVLTAGIAAERLQVTTRAASAALNELGTRGVVSRTDLPGHSAVGRAPQWWCAHEITTTINAWASGG